MHGNETIDREGMLQLQERIRGYLSDLVTAEGAKDGLTQMLQNVGVSKLDAESLAQDTVLSLQSDTRDLSEIEQSIFDRLNSVKVRGGRSATESFNSMLERRNNLISDQAAYFLKSTPNGADVLYMTGHDESFSPHRRDASHVKIQSTNSITDHLQKPFHTAVINNLFHHCSETEIDSTLDFLSKNVNTRLLVFENVLADETGQAAEKEKPVQFMNEYFFKCLLRGPQSSHTNLHASYNTAQGWSERIQKHGWKLAEEENFGLDTRHHLLVFEK